MGSNAFSAQIQRMRHNQTAITDSMTASASTQTQIVRLCLGTALVTLLVFSTLVLVLQANLARHRASEQVQEMTRLVAGATATAVASGRTEEVSKALAALGASPWLIRATVFDATGNVLADHLGAASSQRCLPVAPDAASLTVAWCGARARSPVLLQGRSAGEVVAVLSLELYWRRLGLTLGLCTFGVALTLGLSAPVARRIADRLTQPLHALSKLVERVGQDQDFSVRALNAGPPEVRSLAAGFNLMLEQLANRAQQLQQIALIDPLTGLNNRRSFQGQLEQCVANAVASAQSCALLYIDLDGFKAVNDLHGHAAGDAVLCMAGKRMRQCLRRTDSIYRLGGDEFAIVLTSIQNPDTLDALIDKLRRTLTESYVFAGRTLPRVTASIGVALCPGDAAEPGGLFRHADEAMYEAKSTRRGDVRFYSHALARQRSRRKLIEADIGHAHERGQLFLVYQPQVRVRGPHEAGPLRHGWSITGFEVLTRWHHPELGMVPPDEFIRAAESCGCVGLIDEWVLRQVLSQLGRWREAGNTAVRLSLNVSGQELSDAAAVARMAAMLQASQLPPGSIELEITESTLVTPTPEVMAHMERLRRAGFGLAIDDFGIGFSALSCLEEFPLTTLKVDKSFVGKLARPGHNDAVTRSIIAIAQALGLEVIAEGVESEVQRDVLLQLGCGLMQGYLYAPPLPVDEATNWLNVYAEGR